MIGLSIFLVLCKLFSYIQCDVPSDAVKVNATEAFIFKFYPPLYEWKESDIANGVRYFITMNNDIFELPLWLGIRNEPEERSFYVFGSAPKEVNFFVIRVTAMSEYNFESRIFQLNVTVVERTEYAKYAVQIMVKNVNINDLYNSSQLQNFKNVFDNVFWKPSKGRSYITLFQTAERVPGVRYPINPVEKEGVMVHIGSPLNYSKELFELEREIRPATKNICPGYFKRMSVERFVRGRNLIFNWCYFLLTTPTVTLSKPELISELKPFEEDLNNISDLLDVDVEVLPNKEDIMDSNFTSIMLFLVFIPPFLLFAIFIGCLACLLCSKGKKTDDPYSDDYFNSIFYICEDCFS